jgi:hypothetical protein
MTAFGDKETAFSGRQMPHTPKTAPLEGTRRWVLAGGDRWGVADELSAFLYGLSVALAIQGWEIPLLRREHGFPQCARDGQPSSTHP